MAKNRTTVNATIANGGTVSDSVTIPANCSAVAIVTPASLTGTTFTFQGSADGTTFNPLYNEGTAYSVTVGTSRYISLNQQVLEPVRYLRIVSGSTEGGARTITVVCAEL